MLAANHSSNFDPWPLGIPLFPAPVSPLHGEVRALLVPAREGRHRRRSVSGASRRAGRGGDRDRGRPLPRRARGRHVPGGHTTREGPAQEARGSLAHGRRSDRARGTGTAPPGGNCWNRSHRLARTLARSVRPCTRPRRSQRARRRPRLRRSRRTGCSARSPSSRPRSHETAARRRWRLVRAPRLPRDSEDAPPRRRWPGEHALRVRDDAPPSLAGGASADGAGRLGHPRGSRRIGTRPSPCTRPDESSTRS